MPRSEQYPNAREGAVIASAMVAAGECVPSLGHVCQHVAAVVFRNAASGIEEMPECRPDSAFALWYPAAYRRAVAMQQAAKS